MSSTLRLFLFRHGETEWAKTGQHTGRTDIPLTEYGRQQAAALRSIVERIQFNLVLTSPLSRARETAELAGIGSQAQICDDLAEVDYGEYEGITTKQIREKVPGWTVWTHPCLGGETLQQAAARAQSALELATKSGGNVAMFSHGHMLRVVTAIWLQLPPEDGRHFMLDTSTTSILGSEHDNPAIKIWNAPSDIAGMLATYLGIK